jgi:PAS domain S-box-containing protein
MGNRKQLSVADLAPTANIFPAEFDEIDWPVMFVLPLYGRYPALARVDLDDRPRAQNRVHGEVVLADDTVYALAQIEVLHQAEGNLAPDFHEPRQKARSVHPQFFARPQRDDDGFPVGNFPVRSKLCFRWSESSLVMADIAHPQTKKRKDVRPTVVVNHGKEIFWMIDATTKEVVYVNKAYTTITGRSIEAVYEHPSSYRELIHPQDRIRILTKLQDASIEGSFDEEFQFMHANGSVRWVWVKGFPVRDQGFTRWLVGTAQDITSRKEAETQIAEHLDVAEAARAEAEAFRRSTLALSQNLAMDRVLDTLLECISDLVPYKTASVLFVEDGVDLLIAREAPDGHTGRVGLTLHASKCVFLERILFEHTAILVPDTSREPQWKSVVPLDGARAWLGIPLSAGGHILGILSLGSPKPNEFTSEHLRLAKALAVSAAVAIHNARVHERAEIYAAELEHRLRELQSPIETAQTVNRTP